MLAALVFFERLPAAGFASIVKQQIASGSTTYLIEAAGMIHKGPTVWYRDHT